MQSSQASQEAPALYVALAPEEPPSKKVRRASDDEGGQQQLAASPPAAPLCQYWPGCYRKNPDHLKQFNHPPAPAK